MTLPNFLVIGGLKCGTTSLYRYLNQHPEIYMSPLKETRFFSYDENVAECREKPLSVFPVRTMEEYQELFSAVTDEKAIGEVSPQYLMSWTTPGRIKRFLPDAKIIASLRNPVDRAYSGYLMSVRAGRANESFTDYFYEQDKLTFVRYYDHIKRYFDAFGREQIKIILQEDLKADTLGVTQDLFRFLGVNDQYRPNVSARENVGGLPKNKLLHRLLKRRNLRNPRAQRMFRSVLPGWVSKFAKDLKARNMQKASPISQEVRDELMAYCRDDMQQLQDLMQQDLGVWLGKA